MNTSIHSLFKLNQYCNNINSCIKNYFTRKNYYYFNEYNQLSERKLFVLQRILGIIFGFYQETIRENLINKSLDLIEFKSDLYNLEQINSIIKILRVVSTKKPFPKEMTFFRILEYGSEKHQIYAIYTISHNNITLKLSGSINRPEQPKWSTCPGLDITIKKINEERLEVDFGKLFSIAIRNLADKDPNSSCDNADQLYKDILNTYSEVLQGLYYQLRNSLCEIYLQLPGNDLQLPGGNDERKQCSDYKFHSILLDFGYELQAPKENNTPSFDKNIYEYKYVGSHLESELSKIIEAAGFRSFLGIPTPVIILNEYKK